MTINFTPLFDSLAANAVLIALCVYIFRRRQKETLYNKLSTWYFVCFLVISLGAPIVTAMGSLKTWDELTSIQWVTLACGVAVNAANTMSAFITKAAKAVKEGDGLIPTNGNTQFLNKQDVPPTPETQTKTTEVKTT